MALRKIVYDGDPLLRKQSREVKEINARIQTLIGDMWETMYDANGIGLAAPQVGVLRQVVVIDATPQPADDDENESGHDKNGDEGCEASESESESTAGAEQATTPIPQKYTLVNPELVWASEETVCAKEGCLSVPGRVGTVTRPRAVRVKALDEEGMPVEIETDGLLAKALLHEIDHLHGILYTDIADIVEEAGADESE